MYLGYCVPNPHSQSMFTKIIKMLMQQKHIEKHMRSLFIEIYKEQIMVITLKVQIEATLPKTRVWHKVKQKSMRFRSLLGHTLRTCRTENKEKSSTKMLKYNTRNTNRTQLINWKHQIWKAKKYPQTWGSKRKSWIGLHAQTRYKIDIIY